MCKHQSLSLNIIEHWQQKHLKTSYIFKHYQNLYSIDVLNYLLRYLPTLQITTLVTSISRILINFICTNSVSITEKHSDEICHALFNMPAPVIYNYIILPYNVHELNRWISGITIQLIDMTAIRHQFCNYHIRTYNSDLLRNSFLPLWVNWYIFWFSSNLDPQSKSLIWPPPWAQFIW